MRSLMRARADFLTLYLYIARDLAVVYIYIELLTQNPGSMRVPNTTQELIRFS